MAPVARAAWSAGYWTLRTVATVAWIAFLVIVLQVLVMGIGTFINTYF